MINFLNYPRRRALRYNFNFFFPGLHKWSSESRITSKIICTPAEEITVSFLRPSVCLSAGYFRKPWNRFSVEFGGRGSLRPENRWLDFSGGVGSGTSSIRRLSLFSCECDHKTNRVCNQRVCLQCRSQVPLSFKRSRKSEASCVLDRFQISFWHVTPRTQVFTRTQKLPVLF